MKKLLMGAAVVALLATPAFAQSFDPNLGTGNIAPPVGGVFAGSPSAVDAYAFAPRTHISRTRGYDAQAMAPAGDTVYEDGHNAGTDPDANVRLELQKDWANINE